MMYRYSLQRRLFRIFLAAIFVMIVVFSASVLARNPGREATKVVKEFYRYEQEGAFSDSWSLFHSLMKERFSKGHYIQDRAHVFMNHFGVETFTFELEKAEKVENWKMTKDSPSFKTAYKVPVIQTYKGKYGNFDINQEVFVVKEKEEWRIVWDYSK